MSQAGGAAGTLRDYVRYLQRLGVTDLPLKLPSLRIASQGMNPPESAAFSGATQLAELEASVRDCQACRLHEGRRQVVFGTGNPDADLVFVGEAPGHDEDVQGEPFVGRAGQLLTRIIQAIGLTREDVYILNVIKCRPPQNRNPQPDEVAACRPIIDKQLACLKPRVICALGTFAAQALLRSDERISRLRGRFHPMGDILVRPTFHPAYLLRNPQEKRKVWQDMQDIQRELGLPDRVRQGK
ncbi:MAG: uracil-DNA glycosylase [Candidatus Tectomicrobia bacterium]|nr:uracil-DNA glycosylase [Candidatus Tectomicrobia bacterium]